MNKAKRHCYSGLAVLTTYRKLAEAAVNKLATYYPNAGSPWTKNGQLPGGDIEGCDRWLCTCYVNIINGFLKA